MIVNSGRKYIMENGFNPTIDNLKVYFSDVTSQVIPGDTIPDTISKDTISKTWHLKKETKEERWHLGELAKIETSEDNNALPPLSYLITARTSDTTSGDISSMYITVGETLVSRVVFPTQIVNGSLNTLTIQYHMYF
jgi:hypothetical protein